MAVVDGDRTLEKHRVRFACVYQPKWQLTRMTLSFRDEEAIQRARSAFVAYLTLNNDGILFGCWRIYNLLNAIPLYRMSGDKYLYSRNTIEDIKELRMLYKENLERKGGLLYTSTLARLDWDWNVVRIQLRKLTLVSRTQVMQLYRNLKPRYAYKKDAKSEGRFFYDMLIDTLGIQ